MKPGSRLLISVVAAVLAFAMVGGFVWSLSQKSSSRIDSAIKKFGGEVAEVVVTTRDIAPGTTITSDMLQTASWPVPLLAGDAFQKPEDVVGKVVGSLILSGEPVFEDRLGGKAALQISVPAGMSAFSFPADPVYAVGGAIKVGNKIDLWAVSEGNSILLAKGIEVLATSSTAADAAAAAGGESSSLGADAGSDTDLSWVTVAVDSNTVERLVGWSESTRFQIVLPDQGVSKSSQGSTETSETGK